MFHTASVLASVCRNVEVWYSLLFGPVPSCPSNRSEPLSHSVGVQPLTVFIPPADKTSPKTAQIKIKYLHPFFFFSLWREGCWSLSQLYMGEGRIQPWIKGTSAVLLRCPGTFPCHQKHLPSFVRTGAWTKNPSLTDRHTWNVRRKDSIAVHSQAIRVIVVIATNQWEPYQKDVQADTSEQKKQGQANHCLLK